MPQPLLPRPRVARRFAASSSPACSRVAAWKRSWRSLLSTFRRSDSRPLSCRVVVDEDTPRSEGEVATRLRQAGVDVVEASREDACRALRQDPPDVVSTHATPGWLLEAALELGIPYVETLHGPDHLTVDWKGQMRRHGDLVTLVAVSEQTRRLYLAHDPAFPPDAIVTIPNVVDQARVQPVDRLQARHWLGLSDEFLFICLARFATQKNTYGLVSAFQEVSLARPHAHLLIAGTRRRSGVRATGPTAVGPHPEQAPSASP